MASSPTWRRVLAAGAMAASLVVLAACQNGSAGASGKEAGISVFSLSNQFLAAESQLVTKDLKAHKWDVRPTTDAKSAIDQQVTDVNNLLSDGVTGLVIDPADSAGIVPALKAAAGDKVPVVLVDVPATAGNAYMTIRVDNTSAAGMVCESMGKQLTAEGKKNGTVLELQGILAQAAGRERTDGFESCMKKNFPSIKVVAKPTNWDSQAAADATQTVLGSQHIDGIYMQSDCALQSGVFSALQQAHRLTPTGQSGHIVTGAIDGCPAALAAIKKKELDFTVEQPLGVYAQRAADFLNQAKAGKTVSLGPDGHGGRIVKSATGPEDLIPPVMVTTANVDDSTLWGNETGAP